MNMLVGAVVIILGLLLAASVRLVQQYERGVVLRFGAAPAGHPGAAAARAVRGPHDEGIDAHGRHGDSRPGRDHPRQRDLDGGRGVYFRVIDPIKAILNVENYPAAVSQVALTSLRSVIGRADLDTLLSDRDRINAELKTVIDTPTEGPWGLRVERVEVRDVALPDGVKRSMSRQAEAERERRARVIAADGECQAGPAVHGRVLARPAPRRPNLRPARGPAWTD